MSAPEYIEVFVRHNWPQQQKRWGQIADELMRAAADGQGNAYSLATARNLMASRSAGVAPTSLSYFGEPT